MVDASMPVDSAMRRAARPVGATSAIDARCALAAVQMSRIVAVLPVPGPPVTIERRDANAASTAAHCSGAGMRSTAAGGGAAGGRRGARGDGAVAAEGGDDAGARGAAAGDDDAAAGAAARAATAWRAGAAAGGERRGGRGRGRDRAGELARA